MHSAHLSAHSEEITSQACVAWGNNFTSRNTRLTILALRFSLVKVFCFTDKLAYGKQTTTSLASIEFIILERNSVLFINMSHKVNGITLRCAWPVTTAQIKPHTTMWSDCQSTKEWLLNSRHHHLYTSCVYIVLSPNSGSAARHLDVIQ